MDKLLLGLWKGFYYSGKNIHILKELQEAYGLKALNLVKAAATRWLSHGAACQRCRERYVIITEALGNIVLKKGNPNLSVHGNTLLVTQTVFQITFLEDVLSVTNALSLFLQSDIKDFAAISRIVSSALQILEDVSNDFDSIHLASFNKSAEIIEKIESYEKRNIVSSGSCTKQSQQDYTDTHKEFHEKVIQPFIIVLTKEMKDSFDLTNLSVLNSLLKLDPQGLPSEESGEHTANTR